MPAYDEQYYGEKLAQLIDIVHRYDAEASGEDMERAFRYAQRMHGEQKRESGEPYIIHPYYVAVILAEMEMDIPTITAALLHDCIEDTKADYGAIERQFGGEVAMLVDGVTKLTSIEYRTKDEQKAESLRKMFISMAKDIRVVLIKLADRLHNMRTLKFRDESKRQATARETLDVYAPLAHRLGVYTIKWELEDLALRWLEPQAYYDLVDKIAMKREEREAFIGRIVEELKARMEEAHIGKYDIVGRPKHFYSIYRKMREQHRMFDQIFDLIAMRVMVDRVEDCYHTLGIVHNLWRPIPNRFKDYISMPKPNRYQSLHTTVINHHGVPFEVQIRTFEMHRVAEYGVAAHWKYKGLKEDGDNEQKLTWLRQLLDVQSDIDTGEFMNTVRNDLFADEVFIFTPKGDVVNLPAGATPLDFAYRIHSAIGNKCVGAKVNSRIMTLDTVLMTGDIVEIITSPSAKGPSMDWLNVVKTSQARTKIKQWFKKENKDENVTRGREMLEYEAKRQGMDLHKLLRPEYLEPLLEKYSLGGPEGLFASVGFGALSAAQIITRLAEEYARHKQPPQPEVEAMPVVDTRRRPLSTGGIIVLGEPNMLVRFSRCCNPVHGDAIVGFITRGRGVSIHRADCQNAKALEHEEGQRFIDVRWDGNVPETSYTANLNIIAQDRKGVITRVSDSINQMDLAILDFSARKARNHTTNITASVEVKDTQQLERLVTKLKRLPEVMDVFR